MQKMKPARILVVVVALLIPAGVALFAQRSVPVQPEVTPTPRRPVKAVKFLKAGPPTFKEWKRFKMITVSGAGDSAYNGSYTDTLSTYNGAPIYSNGDKILWWDNDRWILAAESWMSGGEGSTPNYFVNGGTTSSIPGSGWGAANGITAPAPTLSGTGVTTSGLYVNPTAGIMSRYHQQQRRRGG